MLPEEFLDRMKRMLGPEYEDFLRSYEREKYQALRLNPLKEGSRRFLEEAFAAGAGGKYQPVPWCKDGFYYGSDLRPGKHPYHEAGVYYIQEPSAMAPAEYLDVRPGMRVLDLCAAPGGKSTQIAGKMRGRGILVSNEIHPARARILSENIERMGIKNAIVVNETPQKLEEVFAAYFDRIMVDAPCSGEGMFRKNDEAAGEWSAENVKMCARRQDEILEAAYGMLAPGGRMVYSTCTFAPEEDEGSVSRFLERHPEFEMVQVKDPPAQLSPAQPDWAQNGNPAVAHAFRLWPHKLDGEGHFAAVLRKIDGEAAEMQRLSPAPRSKKEAEALQHNTSLVLETVKKLPEGSITVRKDRLFLLPEQCQLDLSGLRVRSCGLALGTLKKNRFEPSHALAHALPLSDFWRVCDVAPDNETAVRYLRGEAFPFDGEKGWTAVAAGGFPMGWGKCAGGMMKNHYPKGLRWVGK